MGHRTISEAYSHRCGTPGRAEYPFSGGSQGTKPGIRNAERELPSEIRYPVERSLELHGTVYDLDNRLLTNTKIQMMAASDSDLVIRELETDAAGVLHVKGIDVTGETRFIFRTKGEGQTRAVGKNATR